MTRRTFSNALKYALAFGLLAFVIWHNWDPQPDAEGHKAPGLKQIWQKHVVGDEPVHYDFLFYAAAITVASISLTFVRWYILVRAVDLPFTLFNAWRLGLVGFFFNTFLPGAVGGDIVKAAFLAREHDRRTVAVATVIMDRVIALWALIWFVAILGTGFWFTGMLENKVQSRVIVVVSIGLVAVTALTWVVLGFLSHQRAERFACRLNSLGSKLPKSRKTSEVLGRIGHSLAEFCARCGCIAAGSAVSARSCFYP